MKKWILLLAISTAGLALFSQANNDSAIVDLDKLQVDQIKVGSNEGGGSELDSREKFHEKIKAILRKGKKTGVIFKDKSNRIFTNGEYKFRLTPENPSELFSHIEYRIDNSEFKRYEEPVALEEEGVYKLSYRGVDKLGNLEELKTYQIRVDRTPPEVNIDMIGEEFKGLDGNVYYKPGVKYELKGYDKASGLNMMVVNINGEGNLPYEESEKSFTKGGEYDLAVRAFDNVYNLSKKTRLTIFIDDKKPTAALKIQPELKVINDKKFCKAESLITLTGKDPESGLSKIEFSFDKTKWQDYGNAVSVPKITDFKFYYRATDNTGNVSDVYEFTCFVDFNPPRTSIKVYDR